MRSIINEKNLINKKILLRLDLNVPLERDKITDTTRIDKILPTLNFLIKEKAKIIILSHVGRPKGKIVEELSLKPICEELQNKLRKKVKLISENIKEIKNKIMELFESNEIDEVSILFNKFVSAISQEPTYQSLIPLSNEETSEDESEANNAIFEFEPDKNELLEYLVPRNFLTQIYRSVLESSASEHAARMTSMDNATRNAGDMIDRLTLTYNRTRQAFITKELIEIISGAEAV